MKIERTKEGYLLSRGDGASCSLHRAGAGGVEAWACAALDELAAESTRADLNDRQRAAYKKELAATEPKEPTA